MRAGGRVTRSGRSQPPRLLPLLALSVILWLVAGSVVVSTDTLGMGARFDHLVDRVRLAIDPPPDREILPTIEVVDPPAETERPVDGDSSHVRATPRPVRKPVDVKLHLNPNRVFASQVTNEWCAVAGTQIILAIYGIMDNSPDAQRRLADQIGQWESWKDSHNGGWGPSAIAEALAAHGVKGYEIRAYHGRDTALRDTAAALMTTRAPVVLIAWNGAHTWVMTGFRADADPTVFRDANVTGTYIYDPWYPRISTIWGPSDPPGTFQDAAEMERNYLRWNRPEGAYVERDGRFIAIVPTIPLRDQAASRD
jgi:hypothetical protein